MLSQRKDLRKIALVSVLSLFIALILLRSVELIFQTILPTNLWLSIMGAAVPVGNVLTRLAEIAQATGLGFKNLAASGELPQRPAPALRQDQGASRKKVSFTLFHLEIETDSQKKEEQVIRG